MTEYLPVTKDSSQQDSFVLDLDPVAENDESCWNIIFHLNIFSFIQRQDEILFIIQQMEEDI